MATRSSKRIVMGAPIVLARRRAAETPTSRTRRSQGEVPIVPARRRAAEGLRDGLGRGPRLRNAGLDSLGARVSSRERASSREGSWMHAQDLDGGRGEQDLAE